MKLFATIILAIALLSPVSAAPPVQPELRAKYAVGTKPNSYIVKLNNGVSKDAHLHWLSSRHGSSANITHRDWSSDVLHGYAGIIGPDALNAIRTSPDVKYVENDGMMSTFDLYRQNNATWGLQRINQTAQLSERSTPTALNFVYEYNSVAGKSADIYIVDTGIFVGHSEFGGRAKWGATYGPYLDIDGHGHGTHCAGTAAGMTYGVAKSANLIAVKVLSDLGSGFTSDIISGLDYVKRTAAASGRPSIVSMSLGGSATQSLDDAVTSLVDSNIPVVVAAGNDNTDAKDTSPARASAAVTVGASTVNDGRTSFSNYGSVVDIFAPGQDVVSAWPGPTFDPNGSRALSGTSMATPHVAGLIAYYLSIGGPSNPRIMEDRIKQLATKDVLTGIPPGTVNMLASTNKL